MSLITAARRNLAPSAAKAALGSIGCFVFAGACLADFLDFAFGFRMNKNIHRASSKSELSCRLTSFATLRPDAGVTGSSAGSRA